MKMENTLQTIQQKELLLTETKQKELREQYIDRVDVLEKVKSLIMLPDIEFMTVAQAEQKMTSFDTIFDINKGEEQTILEIPLIADLKDYIKAKKEQNPEKHKGRNKEPISYDFGITESNVILPLVNAEYLLIMLEILGNNSQVTWSHPAINLKKTYNKGYIFFKSSKDDGILCPVRRNDM